MKFEDIPIHELRGMSFTGGKSYYNKSGLNKWIRGILPNDTEVLYVEPFAGMLGILLTRPPSKMEIVNDLNSHVVNWWHWVKVKPKKMSWHLKMTPRSRKVYNEARERLITKGYSDTFQDAIDFTICILQSARSSMKSAFYLDYNPAYNFGRDWRKGVDKRLMFLSERMRYVQFEHDDAVRLLSKVANRPDTVIYCDPPYYTTSDNNHFEHNIDVDELTAVLLRQQGWVAISGYGDEWDHLNWEKHVKDSHLFLIGGEVRPNQEILWTNYIPEEH